VVISSLAKFVEVNKDLLDQVFGLGKKLALALVHD
jgi:hypothetical protein